MQNKKTNNIIVKGARVNNLQNIDLSLPRNKFIVVTGVSGSGKSSFAFDTLYAEGQRRYVESLSAYARQFLGRMAKPECDYIKGLPPAVAIEQKVNTRNPRSTVGTSTEIYDYIRMLFARIGKTISPISGKEVKKESVDTIVNSLCSLYTDKRIAILSPMVIPQGRKFQQHLEILGKEGYSRLEHDGNFIEIAQSEEIDYDSPQKYNLLIDRASISSDKDDISRLSDSLEAAFFEGNGHCIVKIFLDDKIETLEYSKSFEADGITFREPSDAMFNFNNPYGACPECEGFGKVMGIDEKLVVPDMSLTIHEGAVQCWRGEKMGEWKKELERLATKLNFRIHIPYLELTEKEKSILWHGSGLWPGIDGFFKWVDENQYKIQYRVLKARYRGKTECPVCHGSRLQKDAEYVKVAKKSITDLVRLPISELKQFFDKIELSDAEYNIAKRLLTEINNRLAIMVNVGLGYLTLDRLSSTLSGGESQRINLVTSLGSSLVGSLYILDEPSIGLHPRDTDRLISVLKDLQKLGNTVIVVEHDEEIMRQSDYLVDFGKDAGSRGGNIMYSGPTHNLASEANNKLDSYTADYLSHKRKIEKPEYRRPWKKFIEIKGATENNLKNIDVKFPLGVMTVVTGVSGSGKSTLVKEILYKALARNLDINAGQPGSHRMLTGDLKSIKHVEFVNQNPIGTSSRSNASTYLKAYDEIRQLFASTQAAKQMGFSPAYFSFNTEGGRCEECKGEGIITIPMQFMADIKMTCDSCHGKRFKQEVLNIEYKSKNISDILDMTVDDAIEFFSDTDGSTEQKIVKRLQPLHNVGLGYIKLGQSSSTLSGGENQRVKLAYFLAQERPEPTLFIFDEPTTGLHFHDISTLLKSLQSLIDKGHTVLIIEHNLDVIKSADWIIDIGPEGGETGGNIVIEGTPEQVVKCESSYTGKFLAEKLK